jgi:hypothetical protein
MTYIQMFQDNEIDVTLNMVVWFCGVLQVHTLTLSLLMKKVMPAIHKLTRVQMIVIPWNI